MTLRIGLFRFGLLCSICSVAFMGFELCATGQAPVYDPSLQSGTVPFESYHGSDIDSVNLETGMVSLNIPLISFPQSGGELRADYSIVFSTPVASESSINCGPRTPCTNFWSPPIVNGSAFTGALKIVSDIMPTLAITLTDTGNCATPGACYSSASVLEGDGNQHPMGYLNASTLRALDGSGYYSASFGTNNGTTLVDGNGITYHCSSETNQCTATDLNGNQISTNSSGVIDTLGRAIPVPPNPNISGTNPGSANWTIPGPNAASATYTVAINGSAQITSVTLPNQASYTFEYQTLALPLLQGQTQADSIAALSKVLLPSGGSISYNYSIGTSGCSDAPLAHPVITSRVVDANDGKGPQTWQYQVNGTSTTVIDPLGNKAVHTFGNGACFPYETQTQQFDSGGNLLETIATTYSFISPVSVNTAPYDVLPAKRTTTWANGQQSQVSYTYDRDMGASFSFGVVALTNGQVSLGPQPSGYTSNPWSVVQTDYGSGAPGGTLRTTNTSYQWNSNSNYLTANLLTIPASVKILNGAGTQMAETDYSYDESAYVANPGSIAGSLTSVSNWLNTGGSIVSHTSYNSNGMPTRTLDPKGNATTTSYQCSGAFPSQVVNALNQTSGYAYDCIAGLLTGVQDPNDFGTGTAIHFSYNSSRDVTGATFPDGGSATKNYNNYAIPLTVSSTAAASPDPAMTSSIVYDGLARPSTSMAPNGAMTTTTYDGLGRVTSVSNPHATTSNSTDGTTLYSYDALGRLLVKTQPDGSTQNWSYNGNVTTFTDEAGHSWQRTSDALGRLTNVVEPTGASTIYTYDALSNLLNVNQKGVSGETPRVRSFVYDSLSRLLSSTNPETGTISYSYDANSNVISKTDGRGIKTSYVYDALNRLTQKSFSDGTSSIAYEYDASSVNFLPTPANASRNVKVTLSNSIGRLSAMTQESSGTSNSLDAFSYDSMGRVVQRWTSLPSYNNGGPVYSQQASYDLAGNVTSLTYPDGRVVTQGWDAGGHQQTSIFKSWNGQNAGSAYLSSAAYWPNGAVQTMTYGNGSVVGYTLNSRLQVDEVGAVQPFRGQFNPFFVKLYCYGSAPLVPTLPGCEATASGNNGNIWEIEDTLNGSRSQTYTYDTLNRITSFSLGGRLSQQYGLDSFGNMGIVMAGVTTTTFDSSNRINNLPCANTEAPYDGAGNQFCDSAQDGTVRQIAYDASSQISQIATAGNTANPFVVYNYDATGERIRKNNSDGTFTEYVYFNGQPMAEHNNDGTWSDYIYANGQKIAKADDYDVRIHLSGTNCSNCGSNPNMFSGTTSLTGANGYTVRSGDVLSWRQYQDGSALGGLFTLFTDLSTANEVATDTDGQLINADTTENAWHQRQVDLSAYAGKTIQLIDPFDWTTAPAGAWDIYYADMALTSTDGTVIPLYNGSMMTLALSTNPTVSNPAAVTEKVVNGNAQTPTVSNITTDYYLADALGTTQIELSSGSWPVWQGQFTPFGMELDTQFTPMHYKFTGKERDAESGKDYFGARYYGSSVGRFMSPDPSNLAYADPTNPQSFNLYSYVMNRPLNFIDPNGLCGGPDDDDFYGCNVGLGGGNGYVLDQNNNAYAYSNSTSVNVSATTGNGVLDSTFTGLDSSGIPHTTTEHFSTSAPSSALGTLCGAVPSGTVVSVSGNGNFVGPAGSLDLVTNGRTGEVTGFFSPGYFAGAAIAGGALTGGYTLGNLGSGNSNFAGGFSGISGGGGFFAGSIATSSGGPASPFSGISPTARGHVTTVSAGVQTPGRALSVNTTFSLPTQLGKFWTLQDPATALVFLANQVCKAIGH